MANLRADRHDDRRPETSDLDRTRAAMDAQGGRTMARSEVLAWNLRWSASDKQVLTRHLDRVGAVRFRLLPDGFVRCVDAQDRTALLIAPGHLLFPPHWVNQDCAADWPGIPLSTVNTPGLLTSGGRTPTATTATTATSRAPRREAARRPPEREPQFCPRCFLQLTTSGTCPSCD